jgi:hypothetical protein
VSYSRDIVPLFQRAGCMSSLCHGSNTPESGYNLRTYEGTFGPGDEARNLGMCNVVPGSPEQSYLFQKLFPGPRIGVRMPNDLPPLTAAQIDLVRRWISEGALRDPPPAARPFVRGDADDNGRLNMTDAILVFGYLFLGGRTPTCLDAADADDDGRATVNDGILSLHYLFLGSRSPSQPFPACGEDPSADELSCEAFAGCAQR